MEFFNAFDLKEITSVTLILFAIIDVVGTVPVIIELKRKAGSIDAERASVAVPIEAGCRLPPQPSPVFTGERVPTVGRLTTPQSALSGL